MAALAGEAGRGFAVATAKTIGEIARQIGEIPPWTGEAVEAIGVIDEISGLSIRLAAGTEGQGSATREIVRNVGRAAFGVGDVTANSAGVAEGAGAAVIQVLSARPPTCRSGRSGSTWRSTASSAPCEPRGRRAGPRRLEPAKGP
jgi:methyl-accepting chemotaxis protein